jgi:hypothetical protein
MMDSETLRAHLFEEIEIVQDVISRKVGKPLKYFDFWSLRIGDYRAKILDVVIHLPIELAIEIFRERRRI